MHSHSWKRIGALCFAATLALAGCSGEDGATGPQGAPGAPGANGANGADGANGANGADGAPGAPGAPGNPGMSAVAGELGLVIDGVVSTVANGSTTATLTFTVYPASAVCPGAVCNTNLSLLKQKTFYATEYAAATSEFPTNRSFSFSGITFKGLTADGKGAQYTATKTAATFAPEASQSAFVYGYIGDKIIDIPANFNSSRHYALMDNMASAAKVYGAVGYTATANVSGCEKCHVAPYSKHGYRQATVAGLNDIVACKACHTDQRAGSDHDWQKIVDDPAGYHTNGVTDADRVKYAYTANVMNDTHMSHAMEFAYPQSMANCVTCHEGKLDAILTQANFNLTTCKSCHPVTGTGGTDAKRAPALLTVIPANGSHAGFRADMYSSTASCQPCHADANGPMSFRGIHPGFSSAIYANETTKHAAGFQTAVNTASFDAATNLLTVNFSVTGAAANALVKPTVVISLYGYDSKDFIVGGHASQPAPDGKRNLEWAEGAANNSPRLTVAPAVATGGNTTWIATADLTLWAGKLLDGSVKRCEIGILPVTGLDQAAAVQNDPAVAGYNPPIAVSGAARTFDLVGNVLVADADSYGKKIVSAAKCNACHDALGTTFHSPSYGSAGVVGCRLCHVVGSGGSHLELQSRSIDSYVHAIHSMQPFDPGDMNYADPIQVLRHELHVESVYPSFSTMNCVSCHETGTFDVPDQTLSLPGILSANDPVVGRDVVGYVATVVGPAARACGACHRSHFLNENEVVELAAFVAHTADFSSFVAAGTGTTALDQATAAIMAQLGGPALAVGATVPAGTQIESCSICHPDAGTEHQALFNTWKDGL